MMYNSDHRLEDLEFITGSSAAPVVAMDASLAYLPWLQLHGTDEAYDYSGAN